MDSDSFKWDPRKANSNRRKHGVDFADVIPVFEDETALTRLDDDSGEERVVTIGYDRLGRLIVVVYAWRGDRIRIISARPAKPQERQQYERGQ